MGSVEIDTYTLTIFSHIITYGNAADPSITKLISEEIETMWNEPAASIMMDKNHYAVRFRISGQHFPGINPAEIYQNLNPRNNYFRIEEYAHGNISFVDGLGCNSGYFLLSNLYEGSTTAAHEYGHTLGLRHPENIDIRGKGVPGIMYPRGTLVDPPYQYNPAGKAGDSSNGGTMHPKYRKVLEQDILDLKLGKLTYENKMAILGEFTSLWHADHKQCPPWDLEGPVIMG